MPTTRRWLVPLLFSHAVLASLPLVDFDRMGKVGLAGTFAGLDFFQNSSFTYDSATSTLLSRSTDGQLSALASTNSGGRITAGCALDNVFYLAGSFSSIGSTSANNVASYTPSKSEFASLGSNGPNGQVDAVFCDDKNGNSPGTSVAVWDPRDSTWSKPPFSGLSGAGSRVLSITSNSSESSLFFAGSFITSFSGSGIVINGTNNPNVPFSAGATPFSSSLVPVPLSNAEIVASPSTSDSDFSNAQNILCPSGSDGAGNTWFAADGNTAVVTVRAFSFLSASGVRLGNTFLQNHGTTGFSVTTIPDNNVRTMKYLDPKTNENVTCTDPCPLSTDSSLLYQDFLFEDESQSITGVEIKLSQWTGNAPGLHILQILSSGAFASAVSDENGQSCFAPQASGSTHTGDWSVKVANTDISGTTQSVLVSTVAVGTSASNSPSVTWNPYVSASGEYTVNMLVPGCTNFQDCDLRTTATVTVFAGVGQPWVTEVSQAHEEDTPVMIYTGPIVPSSNDFVMTVTMTLSDSASEAGSGGNYELVADRIELILTSANISSDGSTSGSGSGSSSSKNGFGFFEWPLSSASDSDATQILPNATETSLDGVAFDLYTGIGSGSVTSSSNSAIAALPITRNLTISSGSASGAKNIVAFKDGNLVGVNGGGLNGPVTSMVLVGDSLFVGGSFDDTSSTSTGKLSNVAVYNVKSEEWSSLEGGVTGEVASLGYNNGRVQVVGSFTEVSSSSGGSSASAGGLASWEVDAKAWVNSGGFLLGDMTFVGNGTSSMQFVAGNVRVAQAFGASGMVFVQNSDSDEPTVTALDLPLDGDVSDSVTSSSSSKRKRQHPSRASVWVPKQFSKLWSRQSSSDLALLPDSLPAPAPAVLAGAFWTNTSSSRQVAVIGGNFSFSSGGKEFTGVAIYDSEADTLTGLQGSQIDGVVRTLFVTGDSLYIGGQFTLTGESQNGFAIYNLASQSWNVSGLQPLSADSGANVTVYSITQSSSKESAVFVAGSFAQAGSLSCRGICSLDTSSMQWTTLGNGIKGEVSTVVYAGDNDALLIAGGSIALSGGTSANVASYIIANSTWAAVGSGSDIPGPVTAVEVNSANANSVFAAGNTTIVSQLAMVPLQNTHSADGVIEADRMLMISGTLDDPSFGNASSALYDGKSYYPYIVSSSGSGSAGAVAALFHSLSSFSFSQHHFLATGVVILISIAISAGVVFLLALIGILWTLFSRRDDKLKPYEGEDGEDDDSTHQRPSSLLEHVNAATRATVFGGVYSHYDQDKEEEKIEPSSPSHDVNPFGPDASNYLRAETPSDAMGGIMGEEASRAAHARYSFDGVGEGELRLSAGAEVEILDDRDQAWWYARDVRTGQEGVVPAAYLY
ncbi:hypothetical protein BDZ89DRAFT_1056874 [Hymenopellis radicata]|nr:hypothetical protein BDZ89DRAFT_1056874 [Hymenopellis radicata]